MKYIVCYSGGHMSALTAIETVRKYGKENVILLNHDISSKVEHKDIKRFKKEVADYLELPITYANIDNFEEMTPLKVCREMKMFAVRPGQAFCTANLKTKPFYSYLENQCKDKENYCIMYDFSADEGERIYRRKISLQAMGYKTEFPLAEWERTIENTVEIGIKPPITYKIFKHANCIGCLKAKRQHWYVVYCLRPDIFKEAVETEEYIGHSIMPDKYLKELMPLYESIIAKGICPNDKENSNTFWARVNRAMPEQMTFLPCDCAIL